MSKWSTAVPQSSGIPERMQDIEFVELDDLKKKDLIVKDFEVFESNKDVYTENNKAGVHIVFELEDGELVRCCTHAVSIVKTFRDGDKDIIAGLIEDREPCRIVMKKTRDGKRSYPVLE